MTDFMPFQNAKPVWADGLEKEMNITCGFYASLQKNEGKTYLIRLTASTLYRIFINGKFFNFGPIRCGHGTYRVDELNLTDALQPGENSVAIEVVGYNVNSYYILDQPSFLQAELLEDNTVIAFTDRNGGFSGFLLKERVQKVPKYSFQRAFCEAYRLTTETGLWRTGETQIETPVKLTVTEEKTLTGRGLPPHHYPDVAPAEIYSTGKINLRKPETFTKDRAIADISDILKGFPESELEHHLSNEVQCFEYTDKTPVNKTYAGGIALSEKEYTLLKFKTEKTGFIGLTIDCKKSGVLYLTFDENLRNDVVDPLCKTCQNVIKLEVTEGEHKFLSFEPYGMVYLNLICVSGSVAVSDVFIKEYICPVPVINEYKGSDSRLKKIYKAAKETFLQNAADVFMDCPTRERAGWLCDSYFTSRTEKVLTGTNAVEKVFLENFLFPKSFKFLPEGMLPMCYPSDHYDGVFIPNWAMWFVFELEDYLKRTGDRELVDAFKEKVYLLLDYFKRFENEYSLLEKLESWVFVEWSKANELIQDVNYPSNMAYSYMLKAVGTLYGDKELAQKSEKIADIVRERSFDGSFFCDNEVRKDGVLTATGERTETCQYYAFFFGIATPDTYPELWRRLSEEFGPNRMDQKLYPEIYPSNAFIGNYLRLDILDRFGKGEQCLTEIADYFTYMADNTGTLWEYITADASCNHGFASYVAYLIDKNTK